MAHPVIYSYPCRNMQACCGSCSALGNGCSDHGVDIGLCLGSGQLGDALAPRLLADELGAEEWPQALDVLEWLS